MKKLAITLTSILYLTLVLLSCGPDDPQPTQTDIELAKEALTSGPWKVKTVTVDGVDKTSLYGNLALSFTATSYSATGGGALWPASGTWSFADESGKTITRSDGLSITIEQATKEKLALKLSWAKTTLGAGRVESVSGSHTFSFEK
jgi:hypothetical protein